MKVRVSARARREADRAESWWRANRPSSVNLFTRELLDVLDRLRERPDVGTLYEAERFEAPVRRILMLLTVKSAALAPASVKESMLPSVQSKPMNGRAEMPLPMPALYPTVPIARHR